MTAYGPIGLLGGFEHRPGGEAFDRRLMDLVGATVPNVVVLPAASSGGQRPPTSALARNYWSRLGARVTVATPYGAGVERALEATAAADIIVLPGGHPNKLVAGLALSPVLDAMWERWMAGAAVTGS